uniref:Uncharacterized protein n=1 Tax=Tanacetum cinerariifolium TaxID=118510 RepID=A0A699HM37_TANCI|nr:hypothetical protein [Tanacetum cinerariifolium]
MMREWMEKKTEANERMKNQVVELERQIDQELKNRQAIIENLERQVKYLNEKFQHNESLPRTTNTKPRHDKGDADFIDGYEIKPITTIPNLDLINSNSSTVLPFLKECTVHILYTNAKTFTDDVLLNHAGGEELNSIDSVGNRVLTNKGDKGNGKGGCLEVKSIDLARLC